jgi:hypothetical protein
MPRPVRQIVTRSAFAKRKRRARIRPVIPPFDIFWSDGDGPIFRETLLTLDEAKARVQELGKNQPGEYMIFSQTTGHKLTIKFDPPSWARKAARA